MNQKMFSNITFSRFSSNLRLINQFKTAPNDIVMSTMVRMMCVTVSKSNICVPKPVVICGPSGSGKSTLLTKLVTEFTDSVSFCVSHTTRSPREGEVDGKDYHFVSVDTFKDMIRGQQFIEYTKYLNNLYGTSNKSVFDVQKDGKICILDIELEGVKKLKKNRVLEPLFVFIKPPGHTISDQINVLRRRLERRGSESCQEIERRLNLATEILNYGCIKGNFDTTITTDDDGHGYDCLKSVIVKEIDQQLRRTMA